MEPGINTLTWGMWYILFLSFHVTFGVLALLTFWVPLVTKKGGRTHIRFGTIYLFCMLFVVSTGLMWAIFQLDSQPLNLYQRSFYFFISFISIFTAEAGYYGIRVIMHKGSTDPNYSLFDLGPSGLLVLMGLSLSIYGAILTNPLIALFPWIGILLGLSHLKFLLNPSKSKNQWFFEHMTAMFTCVISTLTAFGVIAVPRWSSLPSDSLVLWFGPTVILVPLLLYFRRRFASTI